MQTKEGESSIWKSGERGRLPTLSKSETRDGDWPRRRPGRTSRKAIWYQNGLDGKAKKQVSQNLNCGKGKKRWEEREREAEKKGVERVGEERRREIKQNKHSSFTIILSITPTVGGRYVIMHDMNLRMSLPFLWRWTRWTPKAPHQSYLSTHLGPKGKQTRRGHCSGGCTWCGPRRWTWRHGWSSQRWSYRRLRNSQR